MQTNMLTYTPVTAGMRECIENCQDCHRVCLETIQYSLAQGERYAERLHLRLLMDCAEICQVSANFMLRGSESHARVCELCARICEDCAQSCDRLAVPAVGTGAALSYHSGRASAHLDHSDEQMSQCSEICRRCAESCKKMSEHAHAM